MIVFLREVEGVGRQVDAVPHPELLPLEAGQGVQGLGVVVLVVQGLKRRRFLLFSLLIDPDAAAAEPEDEQVDGGDELRGGGAKRLDPGDAAHLNFRSSVAVVLGGVSKRANSVSYQNW